MPCKNITVPTKRQGSHDIGSHARKTQWHKCNSCTSCRRSPARYTRRQQRNYCTLSRQLQHFSCALDTRRQWIRQLHTGTSQQLTSDPLQSVHSKLEHQALSNNRLVFYLTVTGLQHYYSCFLKSGSKIQQKSSTNYLLIDA